MTETRIVFSVRTCPTPFAGVDSVEDRVVDRLAAALGPDMSVLTIGTQYFHGGPCEGSAEVLAENCGCLD